MFFTQPDRQSAAQLGRLRVQGSGAPSHRPLVVVVVVVVAARTPALPGLFARDGLGLVWCGVEDEGDGAKSIPEKLGLVRQPIQPGQAISSCWPTSDTPRQGYLPDSPVCAGSGGPICSDRTQSWMCVAILLHNLSDQSKLSSLISSVLHAWDLLIMSTESWTPPRLVATWPSTQFLGPCRTAAVKIQ